MGRRSKRPSVSVQKRRLRIEQLEDRRMLAVFAVDNLDDSGAGSLRQAILDANVDTIADEITFSVAGTIDLASQLPAITQSLTITGPGADLLTLDAGDGADNTFGTGDGYRIFYVFNSSSDLDVEISDLTLTGGDSGTVFTSADSGGAIRNRENLTISSSTIVHNAAPRGGGIYNQGVLTVIDSTIEENHAIAENGLGGGISSFGNSIIKSSTLSGNTATTRGGGLYSNIFSTAAITGSTLSGNSAGTTGGGFAVLGNLTLAGSTVTENEAGQSSGGISLRAAAIVNVTSSIVAGNMAGSTDNVSQALLDTSTHNLIDVDPLLGPLADHGGPTKTHALLPGSPALDAGLVPVHDYELDGSLTDAMGGPDLVALGGTLTAGGYDFGANEGLNLSSANIAPDEYTIEIDFSFDVLGSFQKVIDFKALVVDPGLYTLGNTLRFFGPNFSGGELTAETIHHLVFSRDGSTDEVRASIDGTEAFRFVDSGDATVFSATDQIIRFFQDDMATGQGEAKSGFVDRIRLFDAALELNDQRGATFNRVVGSAVDIGAYESQGTPSFPDGDYNHNGIADAADYTVWLDSLGTTGAGLPADGSGELFGIPDGVVDQADFAFWKANFGNTMVPVSGLASGAGTGEAALAVNVSEPKALASGIPAKTAKTTSPEASAFGSLGSFVIQEDGATALESDVAATASTNQAVDDDLLLLALERVEQSRRGDSDSNPSDLHDNAKEVRGLDDDPLAIALADWL